MKIKKGFTLLEILLVVAAIAILAGIVIVAINPGKQLGDTRNAQRSVDVNTIVNAVYQYYIDNGELPENINSVSACSVNCGEASADEICTTTSCSGLTDLSVLTSNGIYIVSIPIDPQETNANQSGYFICKDGSSSRVTVCAPDAEQDATIEVTR